MGGVGGGRLERRRVGTAKKRVQESYGRPKYTGQVKSIVEKKAHPPSSYSRAPSSRHLQDMRFDSDLCHFQFIQSSLHLNLNET